MDSVQRRQTTSQIYDCTAVTPSDTRLITRSNAMHQNWRYGPVRCYPFVLIVKNIAACKDVQSLFTWISSWKHPPSCATDVIWSQIRDIGNWEVLFFWFSFFLSFLVGGGRKSSCLIDCWTQPTIKIQQQNSNLTINSHLPTFGLLLFKPAIRDVGLTSRDLQLISFLLFILFFFYLKMSNLQSQYRLRRDYKTSCSSFWRLDTTSSSYAANLPNTVKGGTEGSNTLLAALKSPRTKQRRSVPSCCRRD